MLDLNKLSIQLSNASFEISQEANTFSQRLTDALQTWELASENEHELADKLLEVIDHLPWPMGRPLEPMSKNYPLPKTPDIHTVIATDGSQIAPSRHEISLCYLINIGKIVYYYGTGERPIQESEPFLYYREKDLYTQIKRSKFSISEDLISIERSLLEMRELAQLAQSTAEQERPTLAMIDGSLISIHYDVQNMTSPQKKEILDRFISSLNQLKEAQIPVCGYISQSRRNEVINFLRLQRCPFEQALCDEHCAEGNEKCSGLDPLPDRHLWQTLLENGERSPIFASTVKYLEKFEEHETCFFYLNTGSEIARIEIPRWTADKPDYVQLVHALCYDQAQKGMGYPISIQEAHNRAVVRGPDRAQFYGMLSRKMIENKLPVALSKKELRKRQGIV